MNTLTLRRRGGELTLFAPRPVSGGLEADAVLASAPLRAGTMKDPQQQTYRVPAIPERGFYLAPIVILRDQR